MRIPVFLSYANPFQKRQNRFIELVSEELRNLGFEPYTFRVTEYDKNPPLTAVKKMLAECEGVVIVAFRRRYLVNAVDKWEGDMGQESIQIEHMWETSTWCHIEASMAYQMELPIVLFREKGVRIDGIFDKSGIEQEVQEFDLDKELEEYFVSDTWENAMQKWIGNIKIPRIE